NAADAGADPRCPAPPRAEKADRSVRLSRHHIDDPLRHHDHFLRRPAIKRPFYRIEGQNGSFGLGICSISAVCYISAFTTIDLDWTGDLGLDQKICFQPCPRL